MTVTGVILAAALACLVVCGWLHAATGHADRGDTAAVAADERTAVFAAVTGAAALLVWAVWLPAGAFPVVTGCWVGVAAVADLTVRARMLRRARRAAAPPAVRDRQAA